MMRGGGAKGRSSNFAWLLHLGNKKWVVGVLLGEQSSVEVFFKKAAEAQEVELSNNPVPRLNRQTVPTKLATANE